MVTNANKNKVKEERCAIFPAGVKLSNISIDCRYYCNDLRSLKRNNITNTTDSSAAQSQHMRVKVKWKK